MELGVVVVVVPGVVVLVCGVVVVVVVVELVVLDCGAVVALGLAVVPTCPAEIALVPVLCPAASCIFIATIPALG